MTAPPVKLDGLRVAVLAPIAWPTPPRGYGPWEQIAFNIADGMRRRGADVTLFATGNSQFDGRVASVIPVGINEDSALNSDVFSALHIGELMRRADEFDLIHNNFDWKPMTYALGSRTPPFLTTIHGFSSPQILAAYYASAWRSFYCSISNADRDPGLDYVSTTYNGIDPNEFTFSDSVGDYLVFLGRFHPEKGAHNAIEIARRAGVRLKMAAIPHDEEYFRTQVLPYIDGDRVQFLGSVEREARDELLSNALALVHMTTRPERFGLTMVESLACGTPVLGANMGSIPEIVEDGISGFLCDTVENAVDRVPQLATLNRRACRARVEAEFTIDAMIDRYAAAYAQAIDRKLPPAPSENRLKWRNHDWWDRPMAYTDIGERPKTLL
ncbi:MAG: glycosyltransferase family 4 protein [Candidatus Eremiobacteraeota bacterium]|nr:glycosyltransferase family 4 protein [Candidatus Eremiobacteraeota bacterium]